MPYIEPGADWWRDRRWRCRHCHQWFVLTDPYRVTDVRGTIIDASFWCPVCDRRATITRRSLSQRERRGDT